MRPLTTEIVVACKGRSRYFDLDAVRTDLAPGTHGETRNVATTKDQMVGGKLGGRRDPIATTHTEGTAGAPPLDHWWHNDHTGPYNPPPEREPTWPPALCIKPILAMCPVKVCTTCGKPSERIVGEAEYVTSPSRPGRKAITLAMKEGRSITPQIQQWDASGNQSATRQAPTLGWSDCQHNTWRPGVVLDPFASNDTVLAVATSQSRDAIGITPTPRPEWDGMSNATWHTGDSLTVLRTLPSESVDLILTSPPFLALRSYLPADHPDKNLEMGSEGTPGAFLDALLDVVVECRRVLAPHGSLCVELGDTYAGSGPQSEARQRDSIAYQRPQFMENADVFTGAVATGKGWPLDKSLTLIPESFRFALAYGRNPHTGRTLEPWRVRNVVRWCRPNPPVGALGDKVRPATSDIAIACTSRSRYFDLDAVREPYSEGFLKSVGRPDSYKTRPEGGYERTRIREEHASGGAPPLDHWWHNDQFDQDAWHIPTHPYPGAHYATWPPALCIKPILAMCPQRVCLTCGRPSERIVEHERTFSKIGKSAGRSEVRTVNAGPMGAEYEVNRTTLGWSDCHHNTWRNGHVLDPFAGSGTTGVVATGHGRQFTGIDLDPRNHDLARQRIGMWLQEATPGMTTVPTKGLL